MTVELTPYDLSRALHRVSGKMKCSNRSSGPEHREEMKSVGFRQKICLNFASDQRWALISRDLRPRLAGAPGLIAISSSRNEHGTYRRHQRSCTNTDRPDDHLRRVYTPLARSLRRLTCGIALFEDQDGTTTDADLSEDANWRNYISKVTLRRGR